LILAGFFDLELRSLFLRFAAAFSVSRAALAAAMLDDDATAFELEAPLGAGD
jgi:hypothetical protein